MDIKWILSCFWWLVSVYYFLIKNLCRKMLIDVVYDLNFKGNDFGFILKWILMVKVGNNFILWYFIFFFCLFINILLFILFLFKMMNDVFLVGIVVFSYK